MNIWYRLRNSFPFLSVLLLGCAGGEPPVVAAVPMEVEVEEVEVEPIVEVREPELPLRERWQAPFAVSSVGLVEPREPRRVVVIGADSAIAARLVEAERSAEAP